MDFGRLPNIENVDFTLPKTPQQTWEVLSNSPANKKAEVYIGAPVWGEKEWVGKIYPHGTKSKEFLHYYAIQFNSIELNSTHYNFPSELLIEKWKADVPDDFKFCPKITNSISHFNRLVNTDGMVEEFCNAVRLLKNNLGTCFLQMPPNFTPKHINAVTNFIERWPTDIPLSIELRHTGWFSDEVVKNEVFAAMEQYNIGTVITDVAGRRDAAHQRLTNSTAFIRFGANNLHPTDYPRMEEWAALLHTWIEKGLQTAYFFLHTPIKHYNLELATYMIDTLNQKGYNLKAPYQYKKPEEPNPQNSLF